MDRDITQNGKANVVTTIHWRASDTDSDGNTGSSYGSVGVTLGSGSFVAYADIKQKLMQFNGQKMLWVQMKLQQ